MRQAILKALSKLTMSDSEATQWALPTITAWGRAVHRRARNNRQPRVRSDWPDRHQSRSSVAVIKLAQFIQQNRVGPRGASRERID